MRTPWLSSSSSSSFTISSICALGLILLLAALQQLGHLSQQQQIPSSITEIARTTSFTEDELETFDKILARASFAGRTVILTTLNQAWASNGSMLDCFLESFSIGIGTSSLLDHLVVIAMDEPAFKRCIAIHSHCFQMTTKGVDFSAEKAFLSKDYLQMTRQKIFLMEVVLRMGYSFVFTDGDVMWFRDPFQHFPQDADLVLACDYNHGNQSDIDNAPNTGFLYARSNEKTIKFYRFWYSSHETYPGRHDQDVFKAIKGTQAFRDMRLKVWFLKTGLFGGFCAPAWDLDSVYTMHANCCVGLDKKLADIKLMLTDWRRYKASAPEKVKWSVPKQCRR